MNPEMVETARKLRRYRVNGHQRSLREISAELAKMGFVKVHGRPIRSGQH